MNYDEELVMPKTERSNFFSAHDKEFNKLVMDLSKDPGKWKSWVDKRGLLFTAQEIIMIKYRYGKYRHLCQGCGKNYPDCKANPMFGSYKTNVCYCTGVVTK